MVRTIPATFQTAADAASGRIIVLVKITDQPASLYLTSAPDGLSYDSLTWDGDLAGLQFSVGPELDWRGGLASDNPAQIQIIQEHDSADGTATNNTFDIAYAARDFVTPVTGLYEAVLLNESTGDVRISLVFDDGTPIAAESIEVFRGYSEGMSQSNSGALGVRIEPLRQRMMRKTFLRRIGSENTYLNYDAGHANARPLLESADGAVAPLVYGEVPYAKGIAIHDAATTDDTTQSGLMLCFSDARFFNYKGDSDPDLQSQLYTVWGETQKMVEAVRLDDTASPQHEWTKIAVTPEQIGDNNQNRGSFVRFRDNSFAAVGKLIFADERDILSGDPTNANDGDATTYADSIDVGGGQPGFIWTPESVQLPGEVERYYALFKFTCTIKDIQVEFKMTGGGTNLADYEDTPNGTFACDFYDSWKTFSGEVSGTPTYTLTKIDTGFNTTNASDAFMENPATLGERSLLAEVFTTPYPALNEIRFFGAAQYVWTAHTWNSVIDAIYGRIWGIDDTNYTSDDYLKNPAEIFDHFVTEVLGESNRVNAASVTTAVALMNTAGVRLDFQLLDHTMKAEELLDKIAMQSMSWIVPTNSGEERILFRPDMDASPHFDNATESITSDHIIKGTMRSEYTPHDDIRLGAIVNYAWNEGLGKYEKKKILVPSSHRLDSNFTSTELQGFIDAINGDYEALEIDADLIQDDTTAELLCKWLVQLHGRRRQILNFALPLEWSWVEAADTLVVDHPMVRTYASGDSCELTQPSFPTLWPAEFKCATAVTVDPPVPATFDLVPIIHNGDVLFVESGTNAGRYHAYPANSGADVYLYDGDTIGTPGTSGPWRFCPSFDLLSAKVSYSRKVGPHLQVRAIEHPVLRAMSADVTD